MMFSNTGLYTDDTTHKLHKVYTSLFFVSYLFTLKIIHVYMILHKWLFHMTFKKQAFGEFHKFHIK